MLKLPNVSLVLLTSKDFEGAKKAVDKSCEQIDFGAVKIIWDEKIKNIDDWNYKIVYDLWKYVDTSHALLIHQDGYVIHPELWEPAWMGYDFIGAPWPIPKDDYSYRDEEGGLQRVGNSVSLRSRELMYLASTRPWMSYYGYCNEDGFICCHNRKWLEEQGMRFAPLEVAVHFSKEHEIPENVGLETFAFHSL